MTYFPVQSPYPIFNEEDGTPLEDGFIYIGEANQNPITNPITISWDTAGLYPAAQPVRTIGGYPDRNGSPGIIYVNAGAFEDYSILVQDKQGNQIYSEQSARSAFGGFGSNSLDIIDDLRSISGFDEPVYVRGHTTVADGGGGTFEWTDGAAPGTYTDDNGLIIVPTGGDGSGAWIRQFSGPVDVRWYGATGDGSTDDTTAIQAALDSGNHVYVPEGDYLISTTLDISTNGQVISGDGIYSSNISIGADITGINVTGSYATIEKFFVTGSIAHSVTSHGIQIGETSGGGGARTTIRNIRVLNCGGDGIRVSDGNLGNFHDVVSITNNVHGIHMTNENPDNNAWTFSGYIDVRGNGGNGLHIPEGPLAAASDPDASKSHMINSVTAQNNTGYGVYIGTRSNIINVYAESNTIDDIYVANDSGGEGNIIFIAQGNTVTFENPSPNLVTTANIVAENNYGASYARAFYNFLCREGLTIAEASTVGRWKVNVDSSADRTLFLSGYGSSSGSWRVRLIAGLNEDDDTVNVKLQTGHIEIGYDGFGDSIAYFYDDTNDVFRTLRWDDSTSNWKAEDSSGVNRKIWDSGDNASLAAGSGISGSFTTVDGKTVTVTNGIITAIV